MEELTKKEKCDAEGGTLCWRCANAVPNADGSRGCPWSIDLKPVEGWDAIEKHRKCKIYGLRDTRTGELVRNGYTNEPARFTCRSNAVRTIENRRYDPEYIKPEIIGTDTKISYYVYSCPLFKKG